MGIASTAGRLQQPSATLALVPFVVGYVTINRLDPQESYSASASCSLASGLYFRTAMPVQPMKALATVAVTQAGTVTPGMIWAAGFVTGAFAMKLTGAPCAMRSRNRLQPVPTRIRWIRTPGTKGVLITCFFVPRSIV